MGLHDELLREAQAHLRPTDPAYMAAHIQPGPSCHVESTHQILVSKGYQLALCLNIIGLAGPEHVPDRRLSGQEYD